MTDKASGYLEWRKEVRSILESKEIKVKFEICQGLNEHNDSDIEIIRDTRRPTKPHAQKLSRLVNQARDNGYRDSDVVLELQKQLKLALDCHRRCQKFLSFYRNAVDEKAREENASTNTTATSTRSRNRNNGMIYTDVFFLDRLESLINRFLKENMQFWIVFIIN